jgi:WD40 repeat protein
VFRKAEQSGFRLLPANARLSIVRDKWSHGIVGAVALRAWAIRHLTCPSQPVISRYPSLSCIMCAFVLQKTIRKHYDSINTLAFSPDGSLFASGADDGLIIIFEGHGSGNEVIRFQIKAPITTLVWHSRFKGTLMAGDTTGDMHTISLEGSTRVGIPTAVLGKRS